MPVAITAQFNNQQAQQVMLDALRIMQQGGTGPLQPFFRRAAARYLGFIRTRFVRASRGDGTWQDLALSTKINRLRRIRGRIPKRGRFNKFIKKDSGKSRAESIADLARSSKFAILRDTSTLFAGLTEGNPGNVLVFDQLGVTIGLNVFYAQFHQDPAIPGRPPKREILVPPDDPTEEAMAVELANGVIAAYNGGTLPPDEQTDA